MKKKVQFTFLFYFLLFVITTGVGQVHAESPQEKEIWFLTPAFEKAKPKIIAVLPMDNLSLEPEIDKIFFERVHEELKAKGYQRLSINTVNTVLRQFGIQTPGQLAGISFDKLQKGLKCDALLMGEIDQSASIHQGVYDAVVVSCSLKMIDCSSGKLLWKCDQWRSAHRQWQLDPLNALFNVLAHETDPRKKRIAWLVQEMFKTLPAGPAETTYGDLLQKAGEVKANDQ
jgi:hypothetical protein